MALTHLDLLEAEAIHILREVAASFERPVLLYSIGKDSSVLLHLALKAFRPAPLPFPLLHIDTGWKFREMLAFRDRRARELELDLIVHRHATEALLPFGPSAARYTDVMKTEALLQALERHRFDAAIGGARRDEERSRAKERVFSFRRRQRWDPRDQRPELWGLYNGLLGPEESVRAFPLSNWTELDVWHYIRREAIEVVPLYFAQARPVVERQGQLIMLDDARLPLAAGEEARCEQVRFRTLGCYPLTAAHRSDAATLDAVIAEVEGARHSERQGRLIDQDGAAAMERKKQEGYF